MYHFTIIDEASLENEQKSSNMQDTTHQDVEATSSKSPSFLKRTSLFLRRYLNKKNSAQIVINNN